MGALNPARLLEIMERANMFGKRQSFTDTNPDFDDNNSQDDDNNDWWWSSEAYWVKWGILAAVLAIFFIWFVGGHWHAKRRMKKGLPLLAYHRWLVPRSRRPGWRPPYATTYTPYQMPLRQPRQQQWNEPPPLYDGYGMPPTYAPPGKAPLDPEQGIVPPPGPPPQAGPSQQESGVLPPPPAASQR